MSPKTLFAFANGDGTGVLYYTAVVAPVALPAQYRYGTVRVRSAGGFTRAAQHLPVQHGKGGTVPVALPVQ
jgi:hypothetical protein